MSSNYLAIIPFFINALIIPFTSYAGETGYGREISINEIGIRSHWNSRENHTTNKAREKALNDLKEQCAKKGLNLRVEQETIQCSSKTRHIETSFKDFFESTYQCSAEARGTCDQWRILSPVSFYSNYRCVSNQNISDTKKDRKVKTFTFGPNRACAYVTSYLDNGITQIAHLTCQPSGKCTPILSSDFPNYKIEFTEKRDSANTISEIQATLTRNVSPEVTEDAGSFHCYKTMNDPNFHCTR